MPVSGKLFNENVLVFIFLKITNFIGIGKFTVAIFKHLELSLNKFPKRLVS